MQSSVVEVELTALLGRGTRFEGKLTDEEIRQTAAFVLELSRAAGAKVTAPARR